MKQALARDARGETRVIPVILRPVVWRDAPFARLQAVPKDAKPVTTWTKRAEASTDVVEHIRVVARQCIGARGYSDT
jgi:hypothetical protein